MTGRIATLLARGLRDAIRLITQHIELFLISGLIMVAAVQYAIRPQSQSFADIRESGILRVLISDDPDAQYLFGKQHYGFEYELLAAFARSLDAELELEVVPFGELFKLLENGVADLAVGGIINTAFVRDVCQPSIPWYEAQTTVVYQRGTERPRRVEDLDGASILTSARYFEMREYDYLNLVDDHRSEYELLSAVASGEERFVFTTNYRARNAKHYLPDLNRGLILPDAIDLVWALPKRHDPALLAVLNQFLLTALEDGLPNQLANHYLDTPNRLSTFDILHLHKRIRHVLPEYEYAFRKAARRGSIDWHLLAAMAYQESRWSNDARSPTGVQGIMQLTTETARSLGVEDRMDMSKSIIAAGDYIRSLKSRIPKPIKEPERTWFAVAAYNLGLRHVLNAYRKARRMGLESTQWNSVSQLLPTLYGNRFSKGVQAQHYVERVQIFTDVLRFYDLHQRKSKELKPTIAFQLAEQPAAK